jgi:hypothetical protein
MSNILTKKLKLYALPVDEDFRSWFSENMFKGHRKSAQDLANIANAVVSMMLSVGEQNYKEAKEENKHYLKKHVEFLAKQAKKK